MRKSTLIAAATLVLAASSSASAQKSNTQGFMANVHVNGVGITRPAFQDEENDAESGGGAGVRLGWGFSPNFTVFLGLDAATLDFKGEGATGDYGLVHFDLGATYYFANPNRALIPYIEVAATGRAIGSEVSDTPGGTPEEFLQGGAAYTFGAGINYYFARAVALNVGLMLSAGAFENVEYGGVEIGDTRGTAVSSRLNIGMTFFPMKR